MSPGYRKYPESYDKDVPYFMKFMDRYSKSNYPQKRNMLIKYHLFMIEEKNKNILDADIDDVTDFFITIDAMDIKRDSKNKWRNFLNAYYKLVKEHKEKKEKITFINPVPSINLFDFKEKDSSIDELEKEEDLLTYPDINKILNFLYFTHFRTFIIISLILYSGARISEVCHVKLKNIDLEERFFVTRVKSRKYSNRKGAYFFPKFFVKFFKNWINDLLEEYSNPMYLFQENSVFLTPKTPRKHLREAKSILNLNCKMNPHAFRDFINTLRFDQNLNDKYRFLLLNQTPPNVNVKHYLKKYKKRKELLEVYDKTFPFPEFKPNLKMI